jgi:O-antigen/teichoic acid export membrane protein
LRISAVSMLFLTINGNQVGALSGFRSFRALALVSAAGGIATAVLVVGLSVPFGLKGALVGYAAAAALTWGLSHGMLRAECRRAKVRVMYSSLAREMGVLLHFAVPATLAGIAGMLAAWVSTVIIVWQPGGYGEMASFSAAGTLRGAVLFVPLVITRVSAPMLAGLAGAGDRGRHRDALRASVLLVASSAVLVAAAVAAGAPWLLGLFGRSFQGGAAVVVTMSAAGVLEAIGQALNQQFLSRSRMWWNLVMVGSRGAVLVVGTYLLVPSGGALGAAWAALMAYGLAVAFVVAFIARSEAVLESE